jgi:hypothetical protein
MLPRFGLNALGRGFLRGDFAVDKHKMHFVNRSKFILQQYNDAQYRIKKNCETVRRRKGKINLRPCVKSAF